MRSKLIIAFAFVLLATTTVLADMNITASSFELAPRVVFGTASDNFFANVTADTVAFSAGESNDTIYAWSAEQDMITNSSVLLLKRTIDASTLKEKGEDVTLNLTIKSKVPIILGADIGYISFAGIRDGGNGNADQLWLYFLPASADSATELSEVKLMDGESINSTFDIVNIWLQDGYYYVVFMELDISTEFEKAIYLQAVNVLDGSLLFPSAVEVVSLNNPPDTTEAIAGLNRDLNATMLYVVYRVNETGTVFQATVSLPNGKVDEPTALVADNDTVRYVTEDIISASNVFGVGLIGFEFQNNKNVGEALKVYFNGTTSKPQTLDLTIPQDYNLIAALSFPYESGFGIYAGFLGDKDLIWDIKLFNADGSQQAPQKTLITTSYDIEGMILFRDASGAIWLGYVDYDDTNDIVSKGYLGKILA